jgi:cation transporter-like permease
MPRNPYVCLSIVLGLILIAFVGVSGLVATNLLGHDSPRDLVAIVSTAIGSLSSFLVTVPRNSVGFAPEEVKK